LVADAGADDRAKPDIAIDRMTAIVRMADLLDQLDVGGRMRQPKV
jgi:hypothetical protein